METRPAECSYVTADIRSVESHKNTERSKPPAGKGKDYLATDVFSKVASKYILFIMAHVQSLLPKPENVNKPNRVIDIKYRQRAVFVFHWLFSVFIRYSNMGTNNGT